jgi:inosine/xanthosine triphosphate pyrophosphatase family protein/dephospho-CoA kinase
MLDMVFFSSNATKLANFRYIGAKYGIRVKGFKEKHYHATYYEPQIDDREELLRLSYESALKQWRKRTPRNSPGLFFFEDTSVEIVSLSAEAETPGVNVKFWMKNMTFEKLDSLLKAHGNDRRAYVRSDIVVHLPDRLRDAGRFPGPYLHVRGEVAGRICESESTIVPNLVYPWLDAKTFNKWFVPDGATEPLSKLTIQDADKADFRGRAFVKVVDTLKSLHLLPDETPPKERQLDFADVPPVVSLFVVCGPTCAGKTTLAEWLDDNYGIRHIEASDFMRKAFWERHGLSGRASIGDFAEAALQTEPQIVAQPIAALINGERLPTAAVTGFRSPREIFALREHLNADQKIEVIFLSADYQTRFERAVQRNRQAETVETFASRNAQEQRMGLNDIPSLPEAQQISNNSSLGTLFQTFRKKNSKSLRILSASAVPSTAESALQNAILLTLYDSKNRSRKFTTTEIATQINQLYDLGKHKDNVSRYFNQEYHPYFKASPRDNNGPIEYSLSATGVSAAKSLTRQMKSVATRRRPRQKSGQQLEIEFGE